MQNSKIFPQRLMLTLAIASLGAVGCAHNPPPASQRAENTAERAETRTERAADRAEADVRHEANEAERAVDNAVDEPEGPTAMDQSNEPADLEITRHIRAAVVTDSALSLGARNCTIITRGAVVTLRGNVSQQERERIGSHAQAAPGVTRVENLLTVNP